MIRSVARSMDKSIFHGYFWPFLNYRGISTAPAILRISCSAFSLHMRMIIMNVTGHLSTPIAVLPSLDRSIVNNESSSSTDSASPLRSGDYYTEYSVVTNVPRGSSIYNSRRK